MLCIGIASVIVVLCISVSLVLPLRWIDPPVTAFMLADDSGRVPVRYEWADWGAIGLAPTLAVVAAEDQKFAEHFGFDVDSIRDSIEDFSDGEPLRGTANARVKTHLDHRIAMAMAVAGLVSKDGVEVDDTAPIRTSFPNFMDLIEEATE